MVDIKLYYNNTMRQFYFNVLLDGLLYLENKLFDYIIIDNEITVSCDGISAYIDKLNAYCKEIYGYSYNR